MELKISTIVVPFLKFLDAANFLKVTKHSDGHVIEVHNRLEHLALLQHQIQRLGRGGKET